MSMNITELMQELQAGEEARKRIPELGVRINSLTESCGRLEVHNQNLEIRARDREDQISKLLERIRNAEKDRDDALMASLEVEDKLKSFRGTVDKFSSAVASALSGVGAANDKLDPPKIAAKAVMIEAPNTGVAGSVEGNASQPVPSTATSGTAKNSDATLTESSAQDQSDTNPMNASMENAGQGSSVQSQAPVVSSASPSPGQSELGPTASTEAAFASRSPSAPTNPAEPQGSVGIIDTSTVDTRPWWEKEDEARKQGKSDLPF